VPTPKELRALADTADDEAAKLAAQAATLRDQARKLRQLADAVDPLRSIHPKGNVEDTQMEAATPSAGAKKSRAKTRYHWPLQVALQKRNLSLPEWARAQRKPRLEVEKAKTWLKPHGKGGNRCPEEWARRIAAEFVGTDGESEVPAVDASWPCGIRWEPTS
jgi:hypothetical protein